MILVNRMFRPWMLVACGCIVSVAGCRCAEAQSLECRVAVVRDTVFVAEPIWVIATLVTESERTIESDCLRGIPVSGCFSLTNEDSVAMSYTGIYASFSGRKSVQIDGEWQQIHNLIDNFGLGHFDPPRNLPPGRYRVQLTFEGLCESSVDTFDVVEPVGMEKVAYGLFAQGERRSVRSGSSEASLEVYEALLAGHPKSRYAPSAMNSLISVLQLAGRVDETVERCHRFLGKWPDSGFSPSIVLTLLYLTDSEESGLDLLNSIITEYPGTWAERRAGEYLENVRAGKTKLWKDEHLNLLDGMRGRRR